MKVAEAKHRVGKSDKASIPSMSTDAGDPANAIDGRLLTHTVWDDKYPLSIRLAKQHHLKWRQATARQMPDRHRSTWRRHNPQQVGQIVGLNVN